MKRFLIICITALLVLTLYSNAYALTTLYESKSTQVINSGTNLTKYKRLTDKGWLAINIIDIDMKDKNTSIGVLTSENGLQTFQNVKTMLTNEERCIAAINADFFNGNYKKGNIIGMTIKDGKMLTSTYYENEVKDVLASFFVDDNNGAAIGYFSNGITIENKTNGESLAISEINKWSSNYEYPVIYTREWGESSLGLSLGYGITELVVENGKVREIRNGEEAVEIPENGFVVCAIGSAADNIKNIFHKGNQINLDIDVGISIPNVKAAISGGTMLVKNGEIPDFTHVIYGSNPRTALGLSKDCKKVYLITIDGRQASSIGVSQTEFAEILIEKGIYNAINFDGGGSTTMVARELGDEDATIENSPSDGTLRMVPNALGVFNTEKTGSLYKLLLEVDDVNVFVNCKKNITVKGYDEYYNPVEVDLGKIKWSFSGVPVSIEDGVIYAGDEAGSVTITASLGKASGSLNLDVLSMPNELTISPKKATISQNGSITFKVQGQNKNGYYGKLSGDEVLWNVEDENASIENGVFRATKDGSYIVSATAGNATAYALVNVNTAEKKILNDFESENFKFVSYPDEVKGKVELSSEEVFSGDFVAKLTYDFTGTTKTRAAYLRFNNEINLDEDVENVKVTFYATASTSDSVKAKLVDADGDTKYLTLLKGIESNGWQELTLSLKNIMLPAKLIDLYVVQESEDEFTSGSVFFDNLMVEYRPKVVSSSVTLPKDVKGEDAANKESTLDNTNSFRVVVSPEFYSGVLLEQLKYKKMENVINKNSEIVIYPYMNPEEMLANISTAKIIDSAYTISEHKNLSVISLDVSEGGLRITDSQQWISLQSDIKKCQKNILIVLNSNLDEFKDDMEKQLFIDVLCDLRRETGKNIWVIQRGDNTDYSMKRGVRYLTISSKEYGDDTTGEDIQNTKYFLITINDEMTYEIKNVYEKSVEK